MLGYTRQHLVAVIVAVSCLGGVIWLALEIAIPAPPTKITIAGSFKGGHYEALGLRYKDILARSHLKVDVRATDGALENLRLLNDPHSGIQVAFMQGGIANGEQAPDLLSLGRVDHHIFAGFFHPVDETLSVLDAAQGQAHRSGPCLPRRVPWAKSNCMVGGVTSENTTFLSLTPQSAVNALNDGAVDALFLGLSPDLPILQALLRSPKYRPMSFTDADALTRIFPFLVRLVMPRGVVDYETKVPASDVILIATTNVVLVRKELYLSIIDLLIQTMVEVHSAPGIFRRIGEFPTSTDPEYPVAEEASHFYKNGPSFLNRYFLPWVTNYFKRAIALVLTAIAIIVPVFSYSPRLYKWLVEHPFCAVYTVISGR